MSTDQPEASLPESPVEIRACCDSDVEGILPLLHQLWPDAERDDVMLRAAFQHGAKSKFGRFLCATFGGKIVGFCSLSVRESLWQQGLLGHIDKLVVDENYRGRGVGTQLLRRAEEIARQMGCRRIELDSAFHRTQAHAFYERVGYTNRAFEFSKVIATEPRGGTTERNRQAGSVGQACLDEARHQLAKASGKVKHCLNQLTEEQVWWRPTEGQNSIANLILHLCGNVRQWIVAGLGEEPDIRNRALEFAKREPISKKELIRRLDGVLHEADAVLRMVSTVQLLENRRIQGFETTGLSAIFDSISHFKGHTQEIICLTRMQLGDRYQFDWIPSTPEQGAP